MNSTYSCGGWPYGNVPLAVGVMVVGDLGPSL